MSERDEGARGRDESREDRNNNGHQREDSRDSGAEHQNGKPKRSIFRNPLLRIGIVVVVLALIVGGILYWLHARQYESTDDAFIDTHIVQIAPQIAE